MLRNFIVANAVEVILAAPKKRLGKEVLSSVRARQPMYVCVCVNMSQHESTRINARVLRERDSNFLVLKIGPWLLLGLMKSPLREQVERRSFESRFFASQALQPDWLVFRPI